MSVCVLGRHGAFLEFLLICRASSVMSLQLHLPLLRCAQQNTERFLGSLEGPLNHPNHCVLHVRPENNGNVQPRVQKCPLLYLSLFYMALTDFQRKWKMEVPGNASGKQR